MQAMVEQFCDTIDRAYPDDPHKKQQCVRIFSRICEEMFGIVLVSRRGLARPVHKSTTKGEGQ